MTAPPQLQVPQYGGGDPGSFDRLAVRGVDVPHRRRVLPAQAMSMWAPVKHVRRAPSEGSEGTEGALLQAWLPRSDASCLHAACLVPLCGCSWVAGSHRKR